MRKLIYFHVGTLKTGTTTIQQILSEDPRVELSLHSRWYNTEKYNSKPKEVFTNSAAQVWIESDENIARKINEKLGLAVSLKRIKKDYPEAHIVYTIRDQFSAINSMYKHFIRHTFSSMSLGEFLQSDFGNSYLETLLYDDVYKTIQEEFDKSSIHFFNANTLFSNPQIFINAFYQELFGFKPVDCFEEVFENKGFSSDDTAVKKWLNSLVFWRNEEIVNPRELKVSDALTQNIAKIKKASTLENIQKLKVYPELMEKFKKSNEFLRSTYGEDFLDKKYV